MNTSEKYLFFSSTLKCIVVYKATLCFPTDECKLHPQSKAFVCVSSQIARLLTKFAMKQLEAAE